MSGAQKQDYTMEELQEKYTEVTSFYEFAEELVSTVESEFIKDPAAQLAIVEPLIADIGEATDALAEEFILIAESKRSKNPGKASKKRIEASLRRIFAAVGDYQARVKDVGKKAHGAIQNIADPIVQKIQRHAEQIVVLFLEFIQISLQSIMGQTALEALKVRDARVALMMHQHAMQQQG